MVGANPNNCSGSACSTTVEADITPLIVNIDGLTFSSNDVLAATLASPLFTTNDYGSTPDRYRARKTSSWSRNRRYALRSLV
jgi:hypothetical protein